MKTPDTLDYRAIVEQTTSPYLFLKPDMPDYTIIGVNDAYLKATMTTREKIVGWKLFEIFPDNPAEQQATGVSNLRKSLDRVVKNRVSDTMAVQKYDIRRPDGTWEERWWNLVNTPVVSADRTLVCIIHHVFDVTRFFQIRKNKEAEEQYSRVAQHETDSARAAIYEREQALQETNRVLRQFQVALKDLYEQCQTTAAELKRSNTELEQFAYFVSHDLQEPLRAVVGYLSFLKQDLASSLNDNALEDISEAVAGTQRMQAIIQDLLTYSRVNTKGGKFGLIHVKDAVDTAIDNLHSAINENDARIVVETLPAVSADLSQMARLFQNLIGNAIKFHGRKRPQIRIWSKYEGNEWIFAVSDNGIGIESQYYEIVFQIFQRLYTREEYPGTGIGLAVCKRIVERHGGRIWVESNPGEGSTFLFTIPDNGGES
jgi:signal transduction histidine kinase